jgi:processing peptidase subunit alpha
MMNAAVRSVAQCPSRCLKGRYFAAQAQQHVSYSENEFPDRLEAPIITRTKAADVVVASKPQNDSKWEHRIIPSTRRISAERPAHIPPNVSIDSLEIPETKITTLSNGVRVGSMEIYSPVSTVGVLLDFGSRHELEQYTIPSTKKTVSTAGVNHLLELLAFNSTKNYSGMEIRNIFETLGGATFAQSSREQMMYCVDVLRPNVKEAFNLLGETVNSPIVQEMEVEEMKQVIMFQTMDMMPQVLMGEGLQLAAYGPMDGKLQQLGRPHFCTAEALPNLTAESVHAFREQHLVNNPEGIVVSGSGISHEALVELAEVNFGHMKSNKGDSANTTIPSIYTGGEYRLQTQPSPHSAKEEFTFIAVAFEVGGWHSLDLVPTCVLQTLLGGGSSFSAGGPGKGMYSRLYREILNRHRWAESAEAFTSFHSESGLWGISGSCPPQNSREMVTAITQQFDKLADEFVTDEELDRARNMLKCNVLTQLESRLILFEDIGRQILTYGKREDAVTMCAKIDAVTKEDIREVVRKAIQKPPTVSCVGVDISKVPDVGQITQMLGQKSKTRSWFKNDKY